MASTGHRIRQLTAAELALNGRCNLAAGCGEPAEFAVSWSPRSYVAQRRVACRAHAAAFAEKHGCDMPKGKE